jgi:hypothetical protein
MLGHDLLDLFDVSFPYLFDFYLVLLLNLGFLFFKNLLSRQINLLLGPDCHFQLQNSPFLRLQLPTQLILIFLQKINLIVQPSNFSLKFQNSLLRLFVIDLFLQLNDLNLALQLLSDLFLLLCGGCF